MSNDHNNDAGDSLDRFLVYSYTADEAVADGVLIDTEDVAPGMAREAGHPLKVRLSAGLWSIINPEPMPPNQDMKGRLWDTLYMAAHAIRGAARRHDADADGGPIEFTVLYDPTGNGHPKPVKLWACADGTSGPAVHLILPEDW